MAAVAAVANIDRFRSPSTPLDLDAADAAEIIPADAPCALSLAARAGMVLVLGLPDVTDADHPLIDELVEAGVGGVMLRDENLLDVEQATELVDGLRTRLGPHLLVAVDEEGGRVTSLRAIGDRTPSARRLGRAGVDTAYEAGAELGALARSVGIDWIFAPVVDLDSGPAGGVIGDRSFGGDDDEVVAVAGAFATGLRDEGLAVTVKHFPGHGGATDPHRVEVVDDVSWQALVTERLRPFRALMDQGAEAAMIGHVTYPQALGPRPASLEAATYELLRARGFEGVAVTDALGMGAIHSRWGFAEAPALAVQAGADAVLVAQGQEALVLRDGLVAAVEGGVLDEARLDEAVGRVRTLRGESCHEIGDGRSRLGDRRDQRLTQRRAARLRRRVPSRGSTRS